MKCKGERQKMRKPRTTKDTQRSNSSHQAVVALLRGQRMVETRLVKRCLQMLGQTDLQPTTCHLPWTPALTDGLLDQVIPQSSSHKPMDNEQPSKQHSARCLSVHCRSFCRSVKHLGHGEMRMSNQMNIWSMPRQVCLRQSMRPRECVLCCLHNMFCRKLRTGQEALRCLTRVRAGSHIQRGQQNHWGRRTI